MKGAKQRQCYESKLWINIHDRSNAFKPTNYRENNIFSKRNVKDVLDTIYDFHKI